MPDYNIYIRNLTNDNGGGSSETSPTKPQETQPKQPDWNGAFKSVATPGSFESVVNSGASALSKVAPAFAIALAVVKVADKVVSAGFTHLEEYTGNYQYAMAFENAKTSLNNILNPYQFAMNNYQRLAQFNKQNKRIEQERTLIGYSQFTKVGV